MHIVTVIKDGKVRVLRVNGDGEATQFAEIDADVTISRAVALSVALADAMEGVGVEVRTNVRAAEQRPQAHQPGVRKNPPGVKPMYGRKSSAEVFDFLVGRPERTALFEEVRAFCGEDSSTASNRLSHLRNTGRVSYDGTRAIAFEEVVPVQHHAPSSAPTKRRGRPLRTNSRRQQLEQLLIARPGLTRPEIGEAMGWSPMDRKRAIDAMYHTGRLHVEGPHSARRYSLAREDRPAEGRSSLEATEPRADARSDVAS